MIVTCPDCGTETEVEDDRAADVVESHNEAQHDGDPVAGVGPDAVPVEEYSAGDADPLRVHDMGDDGGPLGNHPNGVRGICKDCELVALLDNEFDANAAVETHNDMAHDGDDVAGTCAWDVPDLPSASDILESDAGLDFFAHLGQSLADDQ